MLWDMVFGTFYNEKRRPPSNIGITEHMPKRFRHQLIWPFIDQKRRQEIQKKEETLSNPINKSYS